MALTKIDDRGVTYPLDLLDNEKIRFGTGNDLQIYHNNNENYVDCTNSNPLFIQSDLTYLMSEDGNEHYIKATKDGAVELYYDNVKTFATTTNGAIVYGAEGAGAQLYLYADEGDDNADKWRFSTGNDGDVYFQNYADGAWETNTLWKHGGAVELYYDNVKKLETTNTGVWCTGNFTLGADDDKVRLGTHQDLDIYHGSDVNYIQSHNNRNLEIKHGSDISIKSVNDGAVELYYDGTKKLETTSSGVSVTDHFKIPDDKQLTLGNDDNLYIKHSNGHAKNFIVSSVGDLDFNMASSELAMRLVTNGAVELYYDASKKFDTMSNGITVWGSASVSEIKLKDSGGTQRGRIQTTNGNEVIFMNGGDERIWDYDNNGEFAAYHDNTKKLKTTSDGITVESGGIIATKSSEGYVEVRDERDAAYKAKFLMAGSAPAIRNENTSTSDSTLTVQKGSNTKLLIDGSGNVTAPTTCRFWAKSGSSQTLNTNATNYIRDFNNQQFDTGACYDGTNKFTAPVDGYYHFGWHVMFEGANIDDYGYLFCAPLISGNDISQEVMLQNGAAQYASLTGSHLLYLTANQYVQIRMRQSGGSGNVSVRSDQGYFWGYLAN